jgi:hypothetical protein
MLDGVDVALCTDQQAAVRCTGASKRSERLDHTVSGKRPTPVGAGRERTDHVWSVLIEDFSVMS